MLDQYVNQGRSDALVRFKIALTDVTKQMAMTAALGRRGLAPMPGQPVNAETLHIARTGRPTAAAASVDAPAGIKGVPNVSPSQMVEGGGATALPGMGNWARRMGHGQLAHGKNLLTGIQNIGGEAGRGMMVDSLKGLAPSLLAGGGLYLMHRHNQAEREAQQRQQMMMQGGGMPMQGGY